MAKKAISGYDVHNDYIPLERFYFFLVLVFGSHLAGLHFHVGVSFPFFFFSFIFSFCNFSSTLKLDTNGNLRNEQELDIDCNSDRLTWRRPTKRSFLSCVRCISFQAYTVLSGGHWAWRITLFMPGMAGMYSSYLEYGVQSYYRWLDS